MNSSSLFRDLCAVRSQRPLVHNITNYVVMNTTANALLALGAAPVMAHAAEEVEEMVSIAQAVVINIGTLDAAWVQSMRAAVRAAADRGIPWILDPVGAGATRFRTDTTLMLLGEAAPAVIRGNASEIMALAGEAGTTRGVDSSAASEHAVDAAQALAAEYGCVVSVSGEVDRITDGSTVVQVANGDPLMARVTGMGCVATAMTGGFAGVTTRYHDAASHAMCVMGIAGEMAMEKAEGPGTFMPHFLDALCRMNEADIESRLRLEME